MGRGLMLFLVGMIIMMGMYNQATHQRLLGSQEDMVSQVNYSLATTSAISAMEMAGQTVLLNNNKDFRSDGDVMSVKVEGFDALVAMERRGREITLMSEATKDRTISRVTGRYQLNFDGSIPHIDGAMGVFSDSLVFNMTGAAFEINGCDHDPQKTTAHGCGETLGIAVHTEKNRSIIYDEITGKNKGGDRSHLVIGQDLSPSIGIVETEPSLIDDAIREFLKMDHNLIRGPGNTNATEGSNGSRDNPKIIRVTEGATYTLSTDNSNGSGVIIVDPGSELHMNGNFNYEGLILVQGKFTVARGNMHIWGAILFGGANPQVEVQAIDYKGNINIRYSSQVLETLDEKFSGRATNKRLVLLEQYQ